MLDLDRILRRCSSLMRGVRLGCFVLVLFGDGACKGNNGSAADAAASATVPASAASVTTPKVVKIGDPVAFPDDSTWTVVSAINRGQVLPRNADTEARKTTGTWVSVALRLKNERKFTASLREPVLLDATGRKFEALYDSTAWTGDERRMRGELAPGLQKDFLVIYEVPTDAKGLKIRFPAFAPSLLKGKPTEGDVDLALDLSAPVTSPPTTASVCNDPAFPIPCGEVCCPKGATCNPSAPGTQKCFKAAPSNANIQCKRWTQVDDICEGMAKVGFNCWGGTIGEVGQAYPTCELIADSKFCCAEGR